MNRAYTASTRVLSAALLLIGIAMLVLALARGGGPTAVGVVVGAAFTLLGAGRLYLSRHGLPGGGR